eukprot:3502544-Alexandrium_andersonii.AAC.1
MQPLNRYPVCAMKIPHSWVPASAQDLQHGLVILMHVELVVIAQQAIPQGPRGQTLVPHCEIHRDELRLGS